ncbi:ABC transporter permease [Pseudothermotoga sp. U03pept]|uniref:ABC transporter permease n=1 Tax=Pseudothermotoga sp. U03pept TaxID=3447012 RepID=UPI003F074A4C
MRVLTAVLEIFTNPAFYKLTLTAATPFIFASLGGVFSETTGVVNIALEGIMLMGAFVSIVFTWITGNPWIGLFFAVITGLGMAWLHAWASIKWRGNQIVSGTALILLAQGVTGFLMEPIFGRPGQTDIVGKIPELRIPFLMKNKFLAQSIGELSPMIYMAFGCVVLAWFIIYKTKLGLRMRAVGENPEAADTLGVNVYMIRYFGVLMSGVMASLGGAFLSVGEVGNFRELMTGGRGFIALAAMILGNWNPVGAMWASLLFGFSEAFANQLQSSSTLHVASSTKPLFNMFPFVVTLIVIAGFIGRTRPPAADGIPYEK